MSRAAALFWAFRPQCRLHLAGAAHRLHCCPPGARRRRGCARVPAGAGERAPVGACPPPPAPVRSWQAGYPVPGVYPACPRPPAGQVRDAGNLLTRAGLAIPSVDVDEIEARASGVLWLQRGGGAGGLGGRAGRCPDGPSLPEACTRTLPPRPAPPSTCPRPCQVRYQDPVSLVEHLRSMAGGWPGWAAWAHAASPAPALRRGPPTQALPRPAHPQRAARCCTGARTCTATPRWRLRQPTRRCLGRRTAREGWTTGLASPPPTRRAIGARQCGGAAPAPQLASVSAQRASL